MRDVDISQYYPVIMSEIREFQHIAAAENPEMNLLWQELQNTLDDQFIRDATVNGVARRERMLKIMPFASDTLDERKFRLLARYIEDIPYTVPTLKNSLQSICGPNGYRMNLINNTFTLIVKVELVAKRNLETVRDLLERVVPMNMIIDLDLMYNQHKTFRPFTHRQLQAYKHDSLRNEVIS